MNHAASDKALAQIERRIAEAEKRLAGQRQMIERLAADGQDTAPAEALAREMERHLELMHDDQCKLMQASRGGQPRQPSPLLTPSPLTDVAAILKLQRAGFTQEQIEALAEWLEPLAKASMP